MTSWHERVLDGSWLTTEGLLLWGYCWTCPVGEALKRRGYYPDESGTPGAWTRLNGRGASVGGFSALFRMAMCKKDATAAERILDDLEDAAMELEREIGRHEAR
mgnify:CR=1 FL=1